MSGAEALFAVGIICNAMQIITFGKDALHVYRSMRENGVTDPRLDSYLALAATSYKNLGDQSRGPMPLTSDQQQLLDICEKAHKGLLEFQSKFKALELDEQSRKGLLGMARVVKVGIKTLLQSKELKDLENDFQRYEHLFQTRLIHQVCSQADASALLTQEAFTRLEAAQQNVVIKLAEGHTKLSDLLSRESAAIKDHVQEQHLDTRTDVSKHIRDAELHVKSHVSESSAKVQHDLALRSKEVDDNKRHEQLLASLRYPEMNARKNQVAANSPNTCRWLFETQRSPWSSDSGSIDSYSHETGDSDESSDNLSGKETNDNQEDVDESGLDNDTDSSASVSEEPTPFARWLMSDSGMFWISGKPASGKSTLMKFIATSPLTTENLDIWRPSVKVLTHYFWKPGSGMEKSLRGMLLSLAHQVLLCRVDLVRRLWEEPEMAFIHHKWSQADWALEEIEDLLCRTLEVSDDAFFIIIDGLDESTEFERYLSTPHHNSNVLDRLIQLNKVKICASSREETTFCRCFEGVEKLRIHDLTKHDIREFANSRLGCLPFLNDFDRGRLLNEVTLGADGVFLWVSLVLDSVSRTFRLTNDIEALIERVEHAPRDIMKLFQDIWERSGDDGDVASYQVTASRYLNLALVAQRCVQKYAHCTFERFHSLLAIAIALDTREVVSMLDQVRIAPIPDILAKCSIVEQELRTICCGFLEIGGLDISGGGERVHECLLDYVNKNISFIHRCAVDYLTDTESGALLLGACGWSEEESKARLLGGVMTGYCFVVPLPSFDKPFDVIIHGRTCYYYLFNESYLEAIMVFICSQFSPVSCWREFYIAKSRQWYLAGLLPRDTVWSYSGRPKYLSNTLDLQYLEIAARPGDLPIISNLLEELPPQRFLVSIPAVAKGFLTVSRDYHPFKDLVSFTGMVLSRLLGLTKEKEFVPNAETCALCRELSCQLYSWFFHAFRYTKRQQSDQLDQSLLNILHHFTIAIPDIQDWHRPLPLYLEEYEGAWSKTERFELEVANCWHCFVIVNFASAYTMMCGLARLGPEPVADHIRRCQARFQPIIFRSDPDSLYYAIWPDEQIELAAHLMSSMLEPHASKNQEHILLSGGRPCIAENDHDALCYLINTVGHMDGLPFHPWSPGWEIRDVDEQQDTGTGSGSEE